MPQINHLFQNKCQKFKNKFKLITLTPSFDKVEQLVQQRQVRAKEDQCQLNSSLSLQKQQAR